MPQESKETKYRLQYEYQEKEQPLSKLKNEKLDLQKGMFDQQQKGKRFNLMTMTPEYTCSIPAAVKPGAVLTQDAIVQVNYLAVAPG